MAMVKILAVLSLIFTVIAQDYIIEQAVGVNGSVGDAVDVANAGKSQAPLFAKRRMMLNSDPDQCHDQHGRECEWVDFNTCAITSSGHLLMEEGIDTYAASKAVDGSAGTHWISAVGSGRTRFWQATFSEPTQFSMVVVHSDSWPAAYEILVDDVQCAIMRSSHRAPCELSGHVVTIRLISDAATATMSINEVQLAHTPLIRRIICPFIATLVNEGVLHGCVHTREKLFEVARASGLSGDLTLAHIKGNFLHNPSGVQDVCDMESAPNEHDFSTGINDCPTDFSDFVVQYESFPGLAEDLSAYSQFSSPCEVEWYVAQLPPGAGYYSDPGVSGGFCRTILKENLDAVRQGNVIDHATGVTYLTKIETAFVTPDKDCGIPNTQLFNEFFELVDENQDNYLSVSELNNRADSFDGIDLGENLIAGGSISGSFKLLLEIFGLPGVNEERTIYKSELERILIQRRFPHGYVFGHHAVKTFDKVQHRYKIFQQTLCRLPAKKYGGFCVSNANVADAEACRNTCSETHWCLAAGYYGRCDLYQEDAAAPACPRGYGAHAGNQAGTDYAGLDFGPNYAHGVCSVKM